MRFVFFDHPDYSPAQRLIAAILDQVLTDAIKPDFCQSDEEKETQKEKAMNFILKPLSHFDKYCYYISIEPEIARAQCLFLINAHKSGELQAFMKQKRKEWSDLKIVLKKEKLEKTKREKMQFARFRNKKLDFGRTKGFY